ncbi:hypothetical protein BH23PLA1_BH23PLA1_01590 [soil metagenome]
MQTSSRHLDYYERLRQLDRPAALEVVEDFLAQGGEIEGLYTEILIPALMLAGEDWEADRISVAHEHFISEVTRDLIYRYGPQMWSQTNSSLPVTVACCAPGERHSLGLLMICDLLRACGLSVFSLGEGAPAEAVRDFVSQANAQWLCLSVALSLHLPEARDLIELARLARPNLKVLAGGAAFEGQSERALAIGADHFANDLRDLRRQLPELLRESIR